MDKRDSTPELEELSETECLKLLSRHSLGRVGVVVDGQPQIFPVNYALKERLIVFRTAPGTHARPCAVSKNSEMFRRFPEWSTTMTDPLSSPRTGWSM